MEARKVKITLAAYVWRVAELLNCKLTFPDVQALFDAIAHDTGKGNVDSDMPDDPANFKKAVQREVPFWAFLGKRDKA